MVFKFKKNKKGANQLPQLLYSYDGKSIKIDETGEKFTYIINNNGTIEEFHNALDNFIIKKLNQSQKKVKELKK